MANTSQSAVATSLISEEILKAQQEAVRGVKSAEAAVVRTTQAYKVGYKEGDICDSLDNEELDDAVTAAVGKLASAYRAAEEVDALSGSTLDKIAKAQGVTTRGTGDIATALAENFESVAQKMDENAIKQYRQSELAAAGAGHARGK